ncbi:MAG: hypothetical protein R3200_00905 [Xanthomonadales bacterium]|nr:hypothetical protein [Xanthomonadales bacterium]
MSWKAHGEWCIRVHGQLLLYRVQGAWNAEGAKAYCSAASSAAEPLVHSPWAILGDLTEWQLATLDCQPYIRQISERARDFNCKLQCLIIGDNPLKGDLMRQTVPEDCQLHLPPDLDTALATLAEAGFEESARAVADCGLDELLGESPDAKGLSA